MISMKANLNSVIAGFTLMCIIFAFTGCISYQSRQILPGTEIPVNEKNIIIVHQNGISYLLSGARLEENALSGFIADMPRLVKKTMGLELHLYLDPNLKLNLIEKGETVIPLEHVISAEVYDIELAKSIISTSVLTTILTTVGFYLSLVLFVSCPYAFVYNGDTYEFAGELYPGSIRPDLERHDYLLIGNPEAIDDEYVIRLENRLHEIQNTNHVDLIVYDHRADTEVLIDRNGKTHSLSNLQSPSCASSNYQSSIISEISYSDSIPAIPNPDQAESSEVQSVYVTFERPKDATKAKLVIEARTSLWLDFTFYRFQELFGSKYDSWKIRESRMSGTDMLKWKLDQGVVLSVYAKNNDTWQFVDYFNEPGPMLFRRDVMEIDLSGLPSGDLELKLVSGFLFWEVDSLAIDYSASIPITKTVVAPTEARNQDLENVDHLLHSDDEKYYVQNHIGEFADLRFPAPPQNQEFARTVFLHSKGYYEPIRNFAGKADLAKLNSFYEPLAFPRFAQDLFYELNN